MPSRIVFFLKESWLLMVSSVVFGLLLAVTQSALGPRIAANDINRFNQQAASLLPEATQFERVAEEIAVQLGTGTPQKVNVIKAGSPSGLQGWVFVVQGSGFADVIRLVVAVDAPFENLQGFSVLASNETPGFGDKIKEDFYRLQYQGAPVGEFALVKAGDSGKIDSQIVAITGATVSSQAVVDTMNAYIVPIREQLAQKGLLQ